MSEIDRLAARMMCVGFPGTSITAELRHLIARGVSSVILFTRNYESPRQLCELSAQIKSLAPRPIMICVDQEGGRVQRFREPFTIVPSMREIGQTNDVSLARNVGAILGRELRAVNIDMNLAPVLDVDSNPANPVIGARSFGADPHLVAKMGCALADGLQSAGVAACGKHFPGHGDTSLDTHLDLPRLAHDMPRLEQVELPPFVAAIAAKIPAIMTTHVMFDALDPNNPATMSHRVIHGLLRERLHFDGLVISDDLEMKAIIDHFGVNRAVIEGARASVDLFMICHLPELQNSAIDALGDAVEQGEVALGVLQRANARLDELFARFVKPATPWNDAAASIVGCAAHREAMAAAMA